MKIHIFCVLLYGLLCPRPRVWCALLPFRGVNQGCYGHLVPPCSEGFENCTKKVWTLHRPSNGISIHREGIVSSPPCCHFFLGGVEVLAKPWWFQVGSSLAFLGGLLVNPPEQVRYGALSAAQPSGPLAGWSCGHSYMALKLPPDVFSLEKYFLN